MHRTVLPRLGVLCACLFFLAACGGASPASTPTPTKTPVQIDTLAQAPPTPTPMPTDTPVPIVLPTPTARPENIAPYTGLTVEDTEPLRRRPIFICINNDPVSRTVHYGLSQADLVYEYIVDGFTLTRLTALYQSQAVERIGPVRSARLPNIWMTYMYDGVLACSGGSDEIRYLLKNEVGFPYLDADIDDPSNNVYFFSIGSDYRTRMQVSTAGVRRWLQNTNREKEWQRLGFEYSPDLPENAMGDATTIRITYPGGNSVEWRYDAGLGGYVRFQAGAQQIDQGNGRPIVAQNVIAITAYHELTDIVEDSLGTKGVDVQLHGFGDLRVFRDGKVYEGTWRADMETPPRWLGPGEAMIDLRPGQTWVQVFQQLTDMTYQ